ncbi:MAG: PDDEXK nuclease domain-containing protein [Bifidobacteriaceae bacterium]|jgi:predicted nuclease of restriction endonuclease-like (RecB) superfamily|nr:PDDEXK nuclease domain-containing protein [Bifidobacteriaceae bacterium]
MHSVLLDKNENNGVKNLHCPSDSLHPTSEYESLVVYETIKAVIADARSKVITTVNFTMVETYWEIGRQISQAVGKRADYGKYLLSFLSERLSTEFGKGFTISNLRNMRQFYSAFPIRYALRSELTWTHYRALMRIDDRKRRDFYLSESSNEGWTSRQLIRQINSLYYERLLATQKENRSKISNEIYKNEPQTEADYILKDPYVLEFLGLNTKAKYSESDLEQALIDRLQEFLLELGKGFSFVARQKLITTEHGEHYYIDLVFYNYILKCFIVIDLKTDKLTYQDVGQMDFYIRLFDDKIKQKDDNPTIGIVLVTDKDESIVKYSVLSDKDNIFASKYRLYLPSEDELRQQLQNEREIIENQIELEKNDTGS